MNNTTLLLNQVSQGDTQAASQLLPMVYQELRNLAQTYLSREKPGQTMSATALVHEAFVRLVDRESSDSWDNRGHFFSAAATSMRRILIDVARRKTSNKNGGSFRRIPISLESVVCLDHEHSLEQLLELDSALTNFASFHPVAADVVNLRFFSGLTMEETATALQISPRTAHRHWSFAKAWLADSLGDSLE